MVRIFQASGFGWWENWKWNPYPALAEFFFPSEELTPPVFSENPAPSEFDISESKVFSWSAFWIFSSTSWLLKRFWGKSLEELVLAPLSMLRLSPMELIAFWKLKSFLLLPEMMKGTEFLLSELNRFWEFDPNWPIGDFWKGFGPCLSKPWRLCWSIKDWGFSNWFFLNPREFWLLKGDWDGWLMNEVWWSWLFTRGTKVPGPYLEGIILLLLEKVWRWSKGKFGFSLKDVLYNSESGVFLSKLGEFLALNPGRAGVENCLKGLPPALEKSEGWSLLLNEVWWSSRFRRGGKTAGEFLEGAFLLLLKIWPWFW